MSNASLDRRLRKLEAVTPSDDPRRFLHRPAREWPNAVLDRVLAMTDAERAALLDEPGRASRSPTWLRQPGCDDGTLARWLPYPECIKTHLLWQVTQHRF